MEINHKKGKINMSERISRINKNRYDKPFDSYMYCILKGKVNLTLKSKKTSNNKKSCIL
jgi:hypothetical protein